MESLQEWIILLAHESRPILVEGKKDKKALESFNVKNIIMLDRPLFEIVEVISEKYDSVIILTDLDKEGKKFYAYFSQELGKRGVKIESKYRDFLFRNTDLTQIEGLPTYLANH